MPQVAVNNLTTPLGISKLAIFFFTLCAFAAVSAWSCSVGGFSADYSDIDNGEFFLAIHVLGWLLSIFFIAEYVFFLGNVTSCLPFNYYMADASLCVSWGFMSIIASGVHASDWVDAKDSAAFKAACDGEDGYQFGLAMGFFAAFGWFVSAVLAFLQARQGDAAFSHSSSSQSTTTTSNPDGSTTTTTVTKANVAQQSSQLPY
ncbi:hypothetical protein PTSG_06219 [Salpingoeca rosetta]|uniref:MARVEL domain-containing protein n=1 Tax=Salpingoeca rosetta (strain ATCC 50818 / BSB-021) TaxID=946362 RepID=F2UCA0_SALR5|nr:uncharacterized protein PTSG_06219 [Salpingoeca rosetta]EGD74207.1 hypothetical protein PTSG_06219 [Salpingoeca rosetta]|eukprot:XP_004993107.1 hypothetical protein PTSG_06219 [Salpingoeca rosetta]